MISIYSCLEPLFWGIFFRLNAIKCLCLFSLQQHNGKHLIIKKRFQSKIVFVRWWEWNNCGFFCLSGTTNLCEMKTELPASRWISRLWVMASSLPAKISGSSSSRNIWKNLRKTLRCVLTPRTPLTKAADTQFCSFKTTIQNINEFTGSGLFPTLSISFTNRAYLLLVIKDLHQIFPFSHFHQKAESDTKMMKLRRREKKKTLRLTLKEKDDEEERDSFTGGHFSCSHHCKKKWKTIEDTTNPPLNQASFARTQSPSQTDCQISIQMTSVPHRCSSGTASQTNSFFSNSDPSWSIILAAGLSIWEDEITSTITKTD